MSVLLPIVKTPRCLWYAPSEARARARRNALVCPSLASHHHHPHPPRRSRPCPRRFCFSPVFSNRDPPNLSPLRSFPPVCASPPLTPRWYARTIRSHASCTYIRPLSRLRIFYCSELVSTRYCFCSRAFCADLRPLHQKTRLLRARLLVRARDASACAPFPAHCSQVRLMCSGAFLSLRFTCFVPEYVHWPSHAQAPLHARGDEYA